MRTTGFLGRMSLVVVAVVTVCGAWAHGAGASRLALLVPERYRLVQFGADINAMCKIPLLTYEATSDGMRLFTWSPSSSAWRAMDTAELTGLVNGGHLGVVLLVGREADLPSELTATLSGSPVARIPTLELAQIANALDSHLHFTSKQWRLLASNHGLVLQDANSERRRYGRYGRPSSPASPRRAVPQAPPPPVVVPVTTMETEPEGEAVELPAYELKMGSIPELSSEDPVVPSIEDTVAPPPQEKGVQIPIPVPALDVPAEPVATTPTISIEAPLAETGPSEAAESDPDGPVGPALPDK